MKTVKTIALLMIFSLFSCASALAAGSIKAVNDERNVIISGYAEDAEAEPIKNTYLAFVVYQKDATDEDVQNEIDAASEDTFIESFENIIYIGVGKTDATGNISQLFEMPDDATGGKYTVVAYVGENTPYRTVMNYVRDNDKIFGLNSVNTALEQETGDDFVAIAEDANIPFFLSLFEEYISTPEMFDTVKGKQSFFELLKGKGKYSIENLNSSITLLNKNLDESILLNYAEEIDDIEALEVYMNEYSETIGADISGITDENKSAVYSALADLCDFTSLEKVNNCIIESVVKFECTNAFSWGSIKNVIEAYGEKIGLDITEADVDYDMVYHHLYTQKNSLTDVEAIKNEFNRLKVICKKQTQNLPASGGNGGGGGGGGGGASSRPSAGGVTSTPSVKVEESVDYSEPVSILPFSDVPENFWAYAEIKTLYNSGVIKGVSENSFNPSGSVRREEFVAMLVRALNIKSENEGKDFTDVSSDAWYKESIDIAYDAGIISGKPDGSFGIGQEITRQDIAVMINNLISKGIISSEENEQIRFSDEESISEYAKEAVKTVCINKIISGYPDGSFKPLNKASRAEAATLINRIILKVSVK